MPQTTDNTRGRSRSVVRSTIRAENAVPPAATAVPMAIEIKVRSPIQAPKEGCSAEGMVLASCSTTHPAPPNSNDKASELITMKGVRRNRPGGIRSERSPNQARLNPISCWAPKARAVNAAETPISVIRRRFRSPRMRTPRMPRLS